MTKTFTDFRLWRAFRCTELVSFWKSCLKLSKIKAKPTTISKSKNTAIFSRFFILFAKRLSTIATNILSNRNGQRCRKKFTIHSFSTCCFSRQIQLHFFLQLFIILFQHNVNECINIRWRKIHDWYHLHLMHLTQPVIICLKHGSRSVSSGHEIVFHIKSAWFVAFKEWKKYLIRYFL